MRILGIDPGLQICGYAFVETNKMDSRFPGNDNKLIEAGVIRTRAAKAIEPRLNQIAEDIDAILNRFKPEVVAVEQLYSHYAHPRTAILMGHARGVILQRCTAAGVEIKNYAATRIKKAITGNGHATKEQMQKTIKTILNLKEIPRPADVADAIAVALCCVDSLKLKSAE